jgi:hypothetical protein
MHRNEYLNKINAYIHPLEAHYDGKGRKLISRDFFDLMMGIDPVTGSNRIDLAINRAKRNYDNFDHQNPANEESSTTVFRLAEELLKYRQHV